MKKRLDLAFERLAAAGEKGLALFVTAGYPERSSTPGLVAALAEGGADIVELGMPFSDPLADGAVIQESSARALANGVTLGSMLEDVRTIRKSLDIPIVLMGYLNPILRYGREKFVADAAAAGVDGLILPEVPLEEFPPWQSLLQEKGLAGILLVSPASGERVGAIDRASEGFLYCVSTTGVTGGRGGGSPEYLAGIRTAAKKNRLMIGFGIATPEDAARAAHYSDGVIVGSALIRFLGTARERKEIVEWVARFKSALRRPTPR